MGSRERKDKNTSRIILRRRYLLAAEERMNAYQNYSLSLSKNYLVISAVGQTKGIGADENSFDL